MVGIPPIYSYEWGMVYHCYTHMSLFTHEIHDDFPWLSRVVGMFSGMFEIAWSLVDSLEHVYTFKFYFPEIWNSNPNWYYLGRIVGP